MLKINSLRKKFNDKFILTNVSFEIKPGEILALVGPNGAGKTTTINCITGIVKKDEGEIFIMEQPLQKKDKIKIAVVPEERNIFPKLSGEDYRKIWSNVYPKWDENIFEKLINKYNLPLSEKFDKYSIGMKTLFLVILAVSSGAEILLLDEPTQHLDPTVRLEIMNLIREYADLGKSILVSSHEIFELEEYADSIAIIKNGKIIFYNGIDSAKEQHRVVEDSSVTKESEIIGLIGKKLLVKTEQNIGRFPNLNEIVVGYLSGKIRENIFEN